MFGGNPQQMQQMMQQMGIEFEELDIEEVVMTTTDGEQLVFDSSATVNRMDAQGQVLYQVMGEPTETTVNETETEPTSEDVEPTGDSPTDISESDVELVASRAGVPADAAREALEETGGDLAAAIASLN